MQEYVYSFLPGARAWVAGGWPELQLRWSGVAAVAAAAAVAAGPLPVNHHTGLSCQQDVSEFDNIIAHTNFWQNLHTKKWQKQHLSNNLTNNNTQNLTNNTTQNLTNNTTQNLTNNNTQNLDENDKNSFTNLLLKQNILCLCPKFNELLLTEPCCFG